MKRRGLECLTVALRSVGRRGAAGQCEETRSSWCCRASGVVPMLGSNVHLKVAGSPRLALLAELWWLLESVVGSSCWG